MTDNVGDTLGEPLCDGERELVAHGDDDALPVAAPEADRDADVQPETDRDTVLVGELDGEPVCVAIVTVARIEPEPHGVGDIVCESDGV